MVLLLGLGISAWWRCWALSSTRLADGLVAGLAVALARYLVEFSVEFVIIYRADPRPDYEPFNYAGLSLTGSPRVRTSDAARLSQNSAAVRPQHARPERRLLRRLLNDRCAFLISQESRFRSSEMRQAHPRTHDLFEARPLSLHTARPAKSRQCPHRRAATPRHPNVKPPHQRVNLNVPSTFDLPERSSTRALPRRSSCRRKDWHWTDCHQYWC